VNVPVVPRLSDALHERYRSAHAALAAAYRSAAPEAIDAFGFLQRRLLHESLAYLQPVLSRPTDQLVFPAPRAFLTRTQELRLLGAQAAFRHLDSRVAMHRSGLIPSVVAPTTPIALHALFEGHVPSGRETNAGMTRVTPTAWRPEANSFMHPPAESCEALVGEAIDTANTDDAPAFVRAAWLTFTMLTIHPFVDGNGRTSRALYLGVASAELELGIDWGIHEQWATARYHYVEALQAGQQTERYDATAVDARPFVEFSTEASAIGADLCRRRLEMLEGELVGWQHAGLGPAAALVLMAVRLAVNASPADLAGLSLTAEQLDAAIDELRQRHLVAWSPRPSSRRTMVDPSTSGLVDVR
jgi:hypothetical protein